MHVYEKESKIMKNTDILETRKIKYKGKKITIRRMQSYEILDEFSMSTRFGEILGEGNNDLFFTRSEGERVRDHPEREYWQVISKFFTN